jgi:cytochrome c oxidase cbb3-type subunit 3
MSRAVSIARALVSASAIVFVACEREARRFDDGAALNAFTPNAASKLYAGGSASAFDNPTLELAVSKGQRYQQNAWAVNEGKRWFTWFNCVGCHGQGGGGSGPALMDEHWIYGGGVADIAHSIVFGRPNGMPSYGGKLTQQQVFEIAAYVRSLSGSLPMDVASGRNDNMNVKNPEAMTPGPRTESPR